MRHISRWLLGGCVLAGLVLGAGSVQAAGMDDFQLVKAVPADTMIAVHARDHEGRAFINAQLTRVWEAVQKQRFDKDLRKFAEQMVKQGQGDMEEFEAWWRRVMDLAALVDWSTLMQHEFAYAMRLAPPTGSDFVMMMIPPEDKIDEDFEGLTQILKTIKSLDEDDQILLSTEGRGDSVVHKLSPKNAMMPLSLTMARHDKVLLMGFGTSMADQALALLRGEVDSPNATLASTRRFKEAFAELPAPTDEFSFVDIAKLMAQSKNFAEMAAAGASLGAATDGAEAPPPSPLAFLPKMVEALDLWQYVATIGRTEGMKKTTEVIVLYRDDARQKPLGKALCGGKPLEEPLKFIPQEATNVSVSRGFDVRALYDAVIGFVQKEVPDGEQLIAQMRAAMTDLPVDIEADVLDVIGTEFVNFTAPIPTAFAPSTVMVIGLKDEARAAVTLELLTEQLIAVLKSQNGTVEESKRADLPGFKVVILPPLFAMMPGVGQPVYGVKDGYLFIGNNPEAVVVALQVADGKHPSFAKNERFRKEGLPLGPGMTSFSFSDLSEWGQQTSQMVLLMGTMLNFPPLGPQLQQNPALAALMPMLTKVGMVIKEFNFYQSKCAVTKVVGNMEHTKSVLHYKEPPKPRGREITPAPASENKDEPAAEQMDG